MPASTLTVPELRHAQGPLRINVPPLTDNETAGRDTGRSTLSVKQSLARNTDNNRGRFRSAPFRYGKQNRRLEEPRPTTFFRLRRRGLQSFRKPRLDTRGLIGVNRTLARGLVQSDNRLPDCQAGIRVVFLYRQPRVFDRVARPRAIKTIRFPAPSVLPDAFLGGWNIRHASVPILYVRAKLASRGKRRSLSYTGPRGESRLRRVFTSAARRPSLPRRRDRIPAQTPALASADDKAPKVIRLSHPEPRGIRQEPNQGHGHQMQSEPTFPASRCSQAR